ncbi:MAG: hypothetical protein L6Q75_20330 [Burkholderiaceae bacterium]|nr:hypothetical protein [Burkholderiaceae bacterium]
MTEPVRQQGRRGRHPKGVVSLRKERLGRGTGREIARLEALQQRLTEQRRETQARILDCAERMASIAEEAERYRIEADHVAAELAALRSAAL